LVLEIIKKVQFFSVDELAKTGEYNWNSRGFLTY
jgi:hypothetical protein